MFDSTPAISDQPDNDAQNVSVIPLTTFLEEFGDGLIDSLSKNLPPIYHKPCPKRAEFLKTLARSPYPEQADCVQAVLALLQDQGQQSAIINAEMGTGKTIMGIAAAAALHHEGTYRTLVISPPHLVYKWKREILATVPDAEVWILNGADALAKLMLLQQEIRGNKPISRPIFYILGRVRMRMGFNWRTAIAKRIRYKRALDEDGLEIEDEFVTKSYAACPDCGKIVTKLIADGKPCPIEFEDFDTSRRNCCSNCQAPLWTMRHSRPGQTNLQARVTTALLRLPTIGKVTAARILSLVGSKKVASVLSDNFHELINMMNEEGDFLFTERQAERLEKAFSRIEFAFGQKAYQTSEFIKRYLPKNTFGLCLVDEGHEYKAQSSAQATALGVIVSSCHKCILLTGTLMGGYADDLFFLLWRLFHRQMLEDGYHYNDRNTLSNASLSFMRQHGILKEVIRESDTSAYRTSKANRRSVSVKRAPGFGPKV